MKDYVIPFLISLAAGICIFFIERIASLKYTPLEIILFVIIIILIGLLGYFLILQKRYKKFGISDIQKSEVNLNLKKQLGSCESSLFFMGVSARTILTAETGRVINEAFAKNQQLSLRFLLFDPRETAKGKQRALDETGNEDIWDSWKNIILSGIKELSVLKQEGRNRKIEVRIYKDFPVFRVLLVDNKIIYMNYYGKGFRPSEMPNLMSKKNKNNFYHAIEKFLECHWNSSEIIIDENTNLVKQLEDEIK